MGCLCVASITSNVMAGGGEVVAEGGKVRQTHCSFHSFTGEIIPECPVYQMRIMREKEINRRGGLNPCLLL